MIQSFDNIFYPPVGIAHLTEDLSHLFRSQVNEVERISIRSSSQPNSNPHLGTVTTMMCAFAIAKLYQETYSVPTELIYDILENSPGLKCNIKGAEYNLSLSDTIESNGKSAFDNNIGAFDRLLNEVSKRSNIPFRLRTYDEFQSLMVVRKGMIEIIRNRDKIIPFISPSRRRLHLRFKCPTCKLIDKKACYTKLLEVREESALFESFCGKHGKYNINLSKENEEFFDANTPLRDILQGIVSLEMDKKKSQLSIMVDGGDWSGVWALNVFCGSLTSLGYNKIPPRIFAPLILDWSGAKFSKSLYVRSDAYKYLPKAFTNFNSFLDIYGSKGLDKLWNEVSDWVNSPKKFFRNYSVDYFRLILSTI